jgi:hypothetical protein
MTHYCHENIKSKLINADASFWEGDLVYAMMNGLYFIDIFAFLYFFN